ncbi:hypothetical protein KY338_06610 [Candidatus Woesearchaeota archaeon]|nr:hypothetical protein [Candidatus Woesearchaeota archaeon]MBW3006402.1 hypothetical protein [Candidatus Woesearchaeota archaeon]
MQEVTEELVERISKTAVPYAVIGNAGFYFHLNERKGGIVEVVAGEPVPGATLVTRVEMGLLGMHYEAIIETAEEVPVGEHKVKVASISYLVADNRARKLLPTAMTDFIRCGKIDRKIAEDVRCMLKATDMQDEWEFFWQMMYDFAPNVLE